MRNFMTYTVHQIRPGQSKSRMDGTCSTNERRTRTQFHLETVKCRNHLGNLVVDGKIILKWI
jgi:hypothetical protein